MSFKDMLIGDIQNVFLNPEEFGVKRIVQYDGVTYDGPEHQGIPVVLRGIKQKERRQLVSDHAQGLYQVTSVLRCALEDLGGKQPEKGQPIRINDEDGGKGFFREFYVASSVCELGMLRVELEGIDE